MSCLKEEETEAHGHTDTMEESWGPTHMLLTWADLASGVTGDGGEVAPSCLEPYAAARLLVAGTWRAVVGAP